MYRLFLGDDKGGCRAGRALISLGVLLLSSGIGALAQSTAPPWNANAASPDVVLASIQSDAVLREQDRSRTFPLDCNCDQKHQGPGQQ